MKKMSGILLLTAALVAISAGCRKETNKPETKNTISSLRFIGQVLVPFNFPFRNSTVGGLSSIGFRPDNNTYYIISDDQSALQAARFYVATLNFDASSFRDVTFEQVITLKRPDGSTFPNAATDRQNTVDPEGLAYNPLSGTLFWSSEGERLPANNPPLLVQPFIREVNPAGEHVREFALPEQFTFKQGETGPRRNGVFEGLSVSEDGKFLFAALEEPLFEDGPRAAPNPTNAVVRILKMDLDGRSVVAQYAYPLDKVHAAPNPPGQFELNGVVEVVAMTETKMLVMERSFAFGVLPEFSVKIYEADFGQATDVKGINALAGASYTPAAKKLIADVSGPGTFRVDNLEGMTFGPRLPNGNRSLVMVSDNNFNALQVTQFLAWEVIP
jgi:hypothetical protein